MLAVGMFAMLLPQRSHVVTRAVVSCAAILLVSFLLYRNSLVLSVFSTRAASFVAEALDFVAMLALIVAALVFCYKVSI